MGLFDSLSSSSEIQLTAKSALALAAITLIGIDGTVEDEEIDSLRRIVRNDERALNLAFRAYQNKTVRECISLVSKALDTKQKAAVLVNLLDIAMADGLLAGEEQQLLQLYIDNFEVPEGVTNQIIEVISLKNDFSIF